jgi:hypothetical protein
MKTLQGGVMKPGFVRARGLGLLLVLTGVTGVGTSGCGDLLGLCETKIQVCNESNTNRSYSVSIDGINYGVVEVGDCRDFDVAEGRHVVEINFTNTTSAACGVSAPVVEDCKTQGLLCRT